MSTLVLDASVAAAWLFDDEGEPRADAALTRIESETALVPALWHLEVRGAPLAAERRGRIQMDEAEDRRRFLSELPVRTDAEPSVEMALRLARRRHLSFYDAMYLELAPRHSGAVATLAAALARAAIAESIPLVEPMRPSRQ